MNLEKRRKEKFKKDMAERIHLIQTYINSAHEEFVKYNKNSSLNDCIKLKNAIDSFYENGYTNVQVNRFSYDRMPVSMLKDFKTDYPKQYRQIIRNSKKNGINVNAMLEIRDELNLKIELKKEEQTKKQEQTDFIKESPSQKLEQHIEK